jgi:hypothetical protein
MLYLADRVHAGPAQRLINHVYLRLLVALGLATLGVVPWAAWQARQWQ